MFGPPGHHRHQNAFGGKDCCGPAFFRRFHSKNERLEMLERYKKELEGELEGLKEEIERLGK
ncbi:MAG TPA: hypothetical protein VM054_00655 [bacterium]|nr:hypothetical protein [bacterium]